ncbi:unnamed protein product [Caretta caretta]
MRLLKRDAPAAGASSPAPASRAPAPASLATDRSQPPCSSPSRSNADTTLQYYAALNETNYTRKLNKVCRKIISGKSECVLD